jgi:hypothetical protein
MESRDEFFRLVMIAARHEAGTAAKYSVDRGTLLAHGLAQESVSDFVRAMRQLNETPEFRKYLEGVFLDFADSLFALIDGICGYATDSPHSYKIVDETGRPLGEDLHFDFGICMKDHPPS